MGILREQVEIQWWQRNEGTVKQGIRDVQPMSEPLRSLNPVAFVFAFGSTLQASKGHLLWKC
jgi:hypothetical protein